MIFANGSAIVAAFALASCATQALFPPQESYELQIVDTPEAMQFEVTLQSFVSTPLCVGVDYWPSSDGTMPVPSEVVLLTDKGELEAQSDLVSRYCPGGCGYHRIEPGGELRGIIAYAAFGEPEQIAADPIRQLKFNVTPIYCPKNL